MKKRLLNFLQYLHNFFSGNQFGFQKGKCAEDALLHFCSNTCDGINKVYKVGGLFIDRAKASDTVDHRILLGRLNQAGIRGIAYNWFPSYLSDRYQC